MTSLTDRFTSTFDALAAVGRSDRSGGYHRLTWSHADHVARRWFTDEARRLDMWVESDQNGNLWAWWGEGRDQAVITGSHLDTVADGGPFDGALGVVAGFCAIAALQGGGRIPVRPVAVVAFVAEEGTRFGVPTLGSRLMTGMVDPDAVRALTDDDGVLFADAMRDAGLDPLAIGPDPDRVGIIDAFLEVHIEQGRGLELLDAPVGVITDVWSHGRWRVDLYGRPDHAGTTRMPDRADPMLLVGPVVEAARSAALEHDAHATVGKLRVSPNATNTIPGHVAAWVDVRARDDATVAEMVFDIERVVGKAAAQAGLEMGVVLESASPAVAFDRQLTESLLRVVESVGVTPTIVDAAAGHDAAILAQHVPAAMLAVRNPTGMSHSPDERAEVADCVLAVGVLARLIEELACR